MGKEFDAACRQCGTVFRVSEGGGFAFVRLRCELCGEEWTRSSEELRETGINFGDADAWARVRAIAGTCRCGGRFNETAKQRCPQCQSDRYERTGLSLTRFD
jgi:DNA-directed RNA polymerase subunit M/transcription elongation factor TFIIS